MANESTRFSVTKINPTRGDQDVTVVTTGGTLNGGNKLEVSYLVADFTSTSAGEGKIRLVEALLAIVEKIEKGNWPAAAYTPS